MIIRLNRKSSVPFVILLCIMAAIFLFSSQEGNNSNGVSSAFSRSFCRLLFSEFDEMTSDRQLFLLSLVNRFIRKAAHFTEYMLLGICSYSFLYLAETKLNRFFLPAVAFCAAYAAADEIHQYFVPGRTMKFTDMLLDTAGAALGATIAAVAVIVIQHFMAQRKT